MPGKLTFGYLYDFRNPPQWRRPWTQLYHEVIDVAAWSEQVGFGGAWVPEHHLANDGYLPSPLATISAIAARTKRISLGTWIALAPLYHPTRFASDCAVLDIICGGRLDIGLGIGYRPEEYAAMGVDFTKRGRLFDEWLEIVTRLWAGETVDYAGQHYQLDGVRMMPPAPRGHIPLYIGGFASKAIDRVLTYGEGYVGTTDGADIYVDKLREQGKDVSQGKVRLGDFFTVSPATRNRRWRSWRPISTMSTIPSRMGWRGHGSDEPRRIQDVRQDADLDPHAAVAKYKALQERMPLDHVSMMMPAGLPAERFMP